MDRLRFCSSGGNQLPYQPKTRSELLCSYFCNKFIFLMCDTSREDWQSLGKMLRGAFVKSSDFTQNPGSEACLIAYRSRRNTSAISVNVEGSSIVAGTL